MRTLLACLVVMGGWTVLGLALMGLGRAVRLLITRELADWRLGDIWIGLAISVSFVFATHLLLPVGPVLWLVLAPAAVAGLVLGGRPRFVPGTGLVLLLTIAALSAFYVADRALQPASAYDSGLWHLPTLEWMHEFRAVPGLSNFHGFLAYNSGSSAFAALVGSTVPSALSHHFTNSLLLLLLLFEVLRAALVLIRPRLDAGRYLGPVLLLLCSPALIYPMHRPLDISSPSPDVPALVVSLAAAVYVARAACKDAQAADWVAAVSLLALLPVMRVQLAVFSVGLLLFMAWRGIHPPAPVRSRRVATGLGGLLVCVWIPWVAHGYVLSGYPAYPSSVLGLPVSWRSSPAHVTWVANWVRSWARDPVHKPRDVLADWDWLGGWAAGTVDNTEVLGMMLLIASGSVLMLGLLSWASWGHGSLGRRVIGLVVLGVAWLVMVVVVVTADRYPVFSLAASAAVLATTLLGSAAVALSGRGMDISLRFPVLALGLAGLAMTVAWFFLAPNPRYAAGVLWTTAAVPAAAGISVLASRRRAIALPVTLLVVVVAMAYPARGLQKEQNFALTRADPAWPLGLSEPAVARTVGFSRDGVPFLRPKDGDQCWDDSLPCTPYTQHWRLREPGNLGAGFLDTRRSGGVGDSPP